MTSLAGSATEAPDRSLRTDLRLRPAQQPSWQRLVAGLTALFLPIYATAYAVAAGSTSETRPLAVAAVVTAVLVVVLAVRFARAGLVLHQDGFTRYDVLAPARFVPGDRIASASALQLYDPQTLQAWNQLFLLDAAGGTLLRLRGRYWSDEQIGAVARHMGVPVETVAEPMTIRDLRRHRRTQLHWRERHPVLSMIALTVGGLLVAFVVAAVATTAMPPLSPR